MTSRSQLTPLAHIRFGLAHRSDRLCVVEARAARLVSVAYRYLPPVVAERWIALIRPAVRLKTCRRGEKRVGQLGGLPCLPEDVVWPVWEGEGSLNFVASIDCGRLPAYGLDIGLPECGTLLFFYFDSDDGIFDPEYPPRTVGVWDPESLIGARVIFTPAGTPAHERATPADIQPYDFVPLTAKPILTGPDWSHPAFRLACQDLPDADRAFLDDHANGDAFVSALRRLAPKPWHRVGGHALPVQDAVELEVARAQLGRTVFDGGTWQALQEEGRRWTLLAQIDSDREADMRWGDVGTLYWLIRPEDLATKNFPASLFTWQCT